MNNQDINDAMIKNLETLQAREGWSNRMLGEKAKVSDRMVGKVLNRESQPTIDIVEKLASAFGLAAWQMMMPGLHLHLDLIKNGKLAELIKNYCKASLEGRNYIDRVAAREAGYRPTSPEGLCGGKEISYVGPKSKSARV